MARLTNAERTRAFGEPGKCERVMVQTPWGIRVQCHPAVSDLFLEACQEAAKKSSWRPKRIDGYNFRAVRGSTSPSLHGYALAWDFFITPPTQPPPGGVWDPDNGLPEDFARCFTKRGFTWGATWKRKDVPHIEWADAPPMMAAGAVPAEPEVKDEEEDDDVALTEDQEKALALIPAMSMRIEQLQTELVSDGGYLRNTLGAVHRAVGFCEQYIRETVRLCRAIGAVVVPPKDDSAPPPTAT